MGALVRHVAVIDVGKTNAKLVVHDLAERRDLASRSAPNRVCRDGPYPHADTEGLFAFILAALADLAAKHPIDAISISAHGACCALVDEDGDLALPILDYEHPLGDLPGYETVRPPFSETLSPAMANGLNVGRQLYWLQQTHPDRFTAARHILFHPQYWAFRLTGVAAGEVTSLGCHTDLWAPGRNETSSLVERMGWATLFPPMRSAFAPFATLLPAIAERIGLAGRDIPVTCGIHDSNASLLPHLLTIEAPFSLLSTGTWVVAFAVGGRAVALDPARNTLAHVDAFARPVPAASFMGGREFDLLTAGDAETPSEDIVRSVVADRMMALPPIVPKSGPYPDRPGEWNAAFEGACAARRAAAASLYIALTAVECLKLIGAKGPIVVEGPLARNALVVRALAQISGRNVLTPEHGTGTSAGAALLALGTPNRATLSAARRTSALPEPIEGLGAYAAEWRSRVGVCEMVPA